MRVFFACMRIREVTLSLVRLWLEQFQRVSVRVAGESEGDVVKKTRLAGW